MPIFLCILFSNTTCSYVIHGQIDATLYYRELSSNRQERLSMLRKYVTSCNVWVWPGNFWDQTQRSASVSFATKSNQRCSLKVFGWIFRKQWQLSGLGLVQSICTTSSNLFLNHAMQYSFGQQYAMQYSLFIIFPFNVSRLASCLPLKSLYWVFTNFCNSH